MDNKVTKIETVTHFDLISSTNGVKFFAKVINKNAKKVYNAQVAYYRFDTEVRRDAWIKDIARRYQSDEDRKQANRLERLSAPNQAKVGDILVSSWGYEQTNIDFYQVTRVTNRGVYIREICGMLTDRSTGNGMAGYKKPVPGAFKESEPEKYARVKGSGDGKYSVSDKSYKYTYKTNPGEEYYCSWYA